MANKILFIVTDFISNERHFQRNFFLNSFGTTIPPISTNREKKPTQLRPCNNITTCGVRNPIPGFGQTQQFAIKPVNDPTLLLVINLTPNHGI